MATEASVSGISRLQFRLRTLFVLVAVVACLSLVVIWLLPERSRMIEVKGLVVNGGLPVAIDDFRPGENCVLVQFVPDDPTGLPVDFSSVCYANEDGSFRFAHSVPVGTYQFAVGRVESLVSNFSWEEADLWKGRYGPANTPFTANLQYDAHITIDIAVPSVTAKKAK